MLAVSRPAGAWMSGQVARRWVAALPDYAHRGALASSLHSLALSLWISRHWSAEELLATHGEGASFGRGVVGVDAAAHHYFGKVAGRLAPHEAALLAGMLQSPARFDPWQHPEAARRRRDRVLLQLLTRGWISAVEYGDARRQSLLPE
ncbi:transglycosylase domain-containing protein [Melittangium boletus]|uniref:transglycosylase domain-containing protein n=1 Tax=Melittangium boletus TaxID=83453 RepID=UPI003DA3AACA